MSTCGFTQIGSEVIIVGRDGTMSYDPVHGGMLHVCEDSLPDGIDEVMITRKQGYNSCKLHSSMQICSATVYFETKPSIEFTKNVFIEMPHSFSSIDTQDLCFVKYDHEMDFYCCVVDINQFLFILTLHYNLMITTKIENVLQWKVRY